MKRVILESPFQGEIERNIEYAKLCVRDCLIRGESPMASHLLFAQAGLLRDDAPVERQLGIAAGLSWLSAADAMVAYIDLGISEGMMNAINRAKVFDIPIEYRKILAADEEAQVANTA